jgi:hypothetical protein
MNFHLVFLGWSLFAKCAGQMKWRPVPYTLRRSVVIRKTGDR